MTHIRQRLRIPVYPSSIGRWREQKEWISSIKIDAFISYDCPSRRTTGSSVVAGAVSSVWESSERIDKFNFAVILLQPLQEFYLVHP